MFLFKPTQITEGADPLIHNPSRSIVGFENHRIRVRGGEVLVKAYLIEDLDNPVEIDPWTQPEFKTLICGGIKYFSFEWVSGTPTISMVSYQ